MIEVKDGEISCDGTAWDIIQDAANIYLSVMHSLIVRGNDTDDREIMARCIMASADLVNKKAHDMCMAYIDPKKGIRS